MRLNSSLRGAEGYRNLHHYAVTALKLPDGQAYGLIALVKLAPTVPELKEAVMNGELNVNTARKIVSVINPQNQESWIDKAKNMKQKDLEREVVKENPRKAVREGIKPVAENLSELRCAVTSELEAKVKRVQDLESERTQKNCTLFCALEAMAELYIEKKDPVKRAERLSARKKVSAQFSGRSRRIPAAIDHAVNVRDNGTCTVPGCGERRWVDKHHKIRMIDGGKHTEENLVILCKFHHKQHHDPNRPPH